ISKVRWVPREYVLGLQVRSKWHREQEDIRKGDLVLTSLRAIWSWSQWIITRVVKTHAGADGRVRVAVVRTSSEAVFRRAIHKLVRLPVG
ncbi:hypothetical protein KR067_005018, partial [Drosophila pandora]